MWVVQVPKPPNKQIMKKILFIIALLPVIIVFGSCRGELKPAKYELVNNHRHFNPIPQGEKKDMIFEVRDTCDEPLYIKEIQTSLGLTYNGELPTIIFPHTSAKLSFTYNSILHTGHVEHFINLFGNFERPDGKMVDTTMVTFYFDINVVPPSDRIHDHEENIDTK